LDIEAGTVLATRYRVQKPLGRGGMGEVFAAENIRTGRVVAVKVLRADAKQKSSAVARFKREARAAGAIHSDYVTQVLDVEEDEEHGILIVFEMLEGESLIERLKRAGPMSFDELFPLVEQIWMGLVDAHKAGVIHRDLKPSNVFLERRPDGGVRVKLLDFGISKLPREVGGETLTEMGQSLGTFSFMPPEQIGKAKTVDHRADIYAVATLIYQALSGQLPYAARNILQMVELKTKNEPRRLGEVLDQPIDPALERFLAKALARDPENRQDSAAEALESWRELRRSSVGVDPSSGLGASGMSVSISYGGGRPAPSPPLGSPSAPPGLAAAPQPRLQSAAPAAPSAAYPHRGVPTVSGVPSVVDNTSESSAGDQIATVAMPVQQVRQAIQQRAAQANPGAGLPRLHDDQPGSGTQLMPRGAGGQAATGARPQGQFPPAPPAPRPGFAAPGAPGSTPGFNASFGAPPSASLGASGVNPAHQAAGGHPGSSGPANAGPMSSGPPSGNYEPGPPGDLTTVYRRDTTQPGTASGQAQSGPSSEPRSSKLGMVFGIIVFAVVGFAIAAFAIQFFQAR
jgi:eukaryotic-like serine/threonine-protein kinase